MLADDLHTFSESYKKIDQESDRILEVLGGFVDPPSNLNEEMKSLLGKVKECCLLLKQDLAQYAQDDVRNHPKAGVYLSKVRHDLYNRINAVQGYSEIILDELETGDPILAQEFSKIRASVLHILKLIDGIRLPSDTSLTNQIAPSQKGIFTAAPQGASNDKEDEFKKYKKQFSILIVDDNKENCFILERYLHRIGFTNTSIAYDGYQALAMKDRADLILLDLNMPEMSGIDVLNSIKDDILLRKIMVLVISASDTMENTIECIKFGADDFLTKPFNADLLQVRINACVEKKWSNIQQVIYREKLKFEKHRYEKLLNAVFPPVIVQELTNTGKVQAAYYKNVAVLFADIVSFTPYCDKHDPAEIISNLQEFAGVCEGLAIKNKVQKIKTIGDCFLGVSGMLTVSENPVLDCVNFAHELLASLNQLSAKWQLRIGINFGTVIGGIVGHRQYLFDIWGDTVNTAARVQSLAQPDHIYLSKIAWDQIKDVAKGHSIGEQKLKGKDPVEIFVYEGNK